MPKLITTSQASTITICVCCIVRRAQALSVSEKLSSPGRDLQGKRNYIGVNSAERMTDASVGVPMFQPAEQAVPFMSFNQASYATQGAGAYAQAPGQPAYAQSAYPPPSAYAPPPAYGGTFGAASTFGRAAVSRFEDEPPLLEGEKAGRGH